MASNNTSNKTVLYTYTAPNGSIVSVYNDGTEAIANQTANPIIYSGTAAITVSDSSFTSVTKKGATATPTFLGDTISLGNGVQTVTDISHIDNVIFSNNSGDKIDGRGASGNDSYFGGNGKDELWAGDGKDYLDGGNGADILHGGTNQTMLVGGNGGDVLHGGAGTDTFLYRAVVESSYSSGGPAPVSSPNGWDIIQNFEHGKDKIDFTVLQDTLLGGGVTSQLTGAGPDHLVWRGAVGSDATAGTANPALAHGVWTDSPDANGHTHF